MKVNQMAKIPAPRLSPFDILEVARRPGIRIGYTPFGEAPGSVKYYIGRSVPWKGFKKDAAEAQDSYIKRFKDTFKDMGKAANVADGLSKAIDISKRAAGTYGVATVELAPGTNLSRVVTLPLKVIKQMDATKRVKPIARAILAPGKNAKEVRKETGVKGEYKSLLVFGAGGASPAAPM
jgi:hypothetical protein